MKQALAILLLLIVACYVLPVNVCLAGKNSVACKYAAEKMPEEEDSKKNAGKEFIPALTFLHMAKQKSPDFVFANLNKVLAVIHTVETPPPDMA